jgi:hypothetical protein
VWSAGAFGGGTPLPLGARTVADLAGRAFAIRDADGATLVAGVLPALRAVVVQPDAASRFAAEAGGASGAVTLWLADAAGSLRSVGAFGGPPTDVKSAADSQRE